MTQQSTRSAWSWLRKYLLNPRRIWFWLVAVVILYILVGFLVLPWLATSFAVKFDEDARVLPIVELRISLKNLMALHLPASGNLPITDGIPLKMCE